MKKRIMTLPPVVLYGCLLVIGVCLLWYLARVAFFLTAFAYQQGSHNDPRAAIEAFTQALEHDPNHPDYASGLAGAFLESAAKITSAADAEKKLSELRNAETWLQRAVMLDPANPWNYYQLGRIGIFRGECRQGEKGTPDECSTARYFLAALKLAPHRLFLQRHIGRWFYFYDQEFAFQAIRPMIAQDHASPAESPPGRHELAGFLYHLHLDYQGDQYYAKAQQTCSPDQNHYWLKRGSATIEIGNDDGSGEWRTYLASEQARIHKLFCLPQKLESYTSAALKLIMNNGGSANFTAYFYLDDHLIAQYEQTIPRQAQWYEIPFDPTLLQGKAQVNVYIRVTGASRSGNFLQLWGDQDTPNHASSLNMHEAADLSPDQGIQHGEYLIRLVFKK